MDRLGFVKTVEAILASIIIISMYSLVQSHISGQFHYFNRNPDTSMIDFMNMLDENELLYSIVNDYDYATLDMILNLLFTKSIYYYFEPVYYEEVIVSSSINKTMPNLSFNYYFPKGVDKNSIRVSDSVYNLPTKALFNYYAVPIIFKQDLNNSLVEVNLSVRHQMLSNKTLLYYVNGKRSTLDLNYWAETSEGYNLSLILWVPDYKKDTETTLFIGTNESLLNQTYQDYKKNREVNYTILNSYESRMAEVIFTPQSVNSEETATYYLTYSLFTNEADKYDTINLINNSGVIIDPKLDVLKEGSVPLYNFQKGEYSIKKTISKDNGFVVITLYGGYP